MRSYYRARSRVPAVLGSLWGAGVYGLSESGRRRFGAFPDVVADDLWVDRLFAEEEVEIVDCAPVVVTVPRRSRDLCGCSVVPTGERGARARTRSSQPRAGDHELHAPRPRGAGLTGPAAALDAATYAAFAREPGWRWRLLQWRRPACRRAVGAGRELEGGLR